MSDFNQDRIDKAQTHIVKLVFPNTTNHYDTLFGGIALQWMDEIAYITANRFSRQEFVTVSLDRINFEKFEWMCSLKVCHRKNGRWRFRGHSRW
jgi:acyl-CoA hydrolase